MIPWNRGRVHQGEGGEHLLPQEDMGGSGHLVGGGCPDVWHELFSGHKELAPVPLACLLPLGWAWGALSAVGMPCLGRLCSGNLHPGRGPQVGGYEPWPLVIQPET